jgi:hypothetical protein
MTAPAGLVCRESGDGRRNGAETRLRSSVSVVRTKRARLRHGSAEPILARSAETSDNRVTRPDVLAPGRIALAETPAGETLKAGQASQRCHIHTITDRDKKQPAAENLTRIGREMAERLKLVRRADGKIAS